MKILSVLFILLSIGIINSQASDKNGIKYPYPDPTDEQVSEWINEYESKLRDSVKALKVDYTILQTIEEKDPGLAYLIIRSESDHQKAQSRLRLYSMLSQNQIDKMYATLLKTMYAETKIEKEQHEESLKVKQNFMSDIDIPEVISAQLTDSVLTESGLSFFKNISTKEEIQNWRTINEDTLKIILFENYDELILQSDYEDYQIPSGMLVRDFGLIYLIATSKSLDKKEEKQEWFDLYSLMNEEQIYKLYNILLKERYKLIEIDEKYRVQKQVQMVVMEKQINEIINTQTHL